MRLSALPFLVLFSAACFNALAIPTKAGVLLYATSAHTNSAFTVNSNGTTTPFTSGSQVAVIRAASGIAVDASGNVYVASEADSVIQKFTSTGALIGTFADSHISAPLGMAFNAAGHLFVANSLSNNAGSISEFSATGTFVKTFATGLYWPSGMVFDASGNLYVSDYINGPGPGRIRKYDTNGSVVTTITSGLSWPGQLALDMAGNLYASNAGGNTISKYNGAGTYLGQFAIGSGSNNYGLAYDADSNTFFQATYGPQPNPFGAIQRFDANGASLGYLALDRGNAYYLATVPQSQIAAVPEPSAILWAGVLGLIGVTLRQRRRCIS